MADARKPAEWAAIVSGLADKRGLRYESVGGINPSGGPVALCPGGHNRLTGELDRGFWGASCDANERPIGRWRSRVVLPEAVLVKAHTPDLASVVPNFNIESIEARPNEQLRKHLARRVEMESIEFNKRFHATVPTDHDPIALRELFSPAFLDWVVRIDRECDFGCSDRQLWFLWRLSERSTEELTTALNIAGGLFSRIQKELEEERAIPAPPGPWNAGLEPFPASSSS